MILALLGLGKDDWASLESVAKIAALILAGVWTYLLFVQKRQTFPRATLSHDVVAIPVDEHKTLVRVTTRVQNDGDVLMQLTSGFTCIQQMKPWPTEFLDSKVDVATLITDDKREGPWPALSSRNLKFEPGETEIEPKEADEFHWDFVVDNSVEILVIYTYLKNQAKKFRIKHWNQKVKAIGWSVSSVFDVKNNRFVRPSNPQQENDV